MEPEVKIALAALFVSIFALVASTWISIWAVRHTRRAADAAVRQTALLESQHETATGPMFKVKDAEWFISGERQAVATLAMTSGPALASVRVTAKGKDLRGLVDKI